VHFDAPAARPPEKFPGVPVAGLGRHLGTLTRVAERPVYLRTEVLDAPEDGLAATATGGTTVGGTLHALTGEQRLRIGTVVDAPSPDPLGRVLTERFDLRDLQAGTLAAALGGGGGTAHLLRFVAVRSGLLVGGYSVLVTS